MEVPPFRSGMRNYGLHYRHLCHQGKGPFVVDSMCLCVTFLYESRFVAVDGTVSVHYPTSRSCIANASPRSWLNNLSRIPGCFRKHFRLTYYRHLHHKGIVICHIVVVAESANRVLLIGEVTKLFICRGEGFLNSDGYIEAV